MEIPTLLLVSVSILMAAIIGARSGIATAFLEIIAGLLIGNIFDVNMSEFLVIMAQLGLTTLMFMAGLEVDIRFLRHKLRESLTVGLIAYSIPFAIIYLLSRYVFGFEWNQSILFALALCTSSAGIVYPVLKQKGPLGPRRKMILSSVMVMEFISMSLLGILYSDISISVLLIVLFIPLVGLVLPKIQNRFHIFLGASQENLAIKLILVLLLVSELLSSTSGVDVILIVFVLGMVMADFVASHETLKKEIETIGFGLLTPIFFFTVGMSISVVQLITNAWEVFVFVSISFIATFTVTYLIAKKHFPSRARIIAILFNAPLSVGIVVATVGRDKSILSTEQYGILIGSVVLMSFIAAVFGQYPASKSSEA
ncbi:MAG: hypothetical protein COW24_00590 [Candidatus Kerfeldbacteria bacterium CG15_BIG_FIL_POST_REV_8_21_14_020_45_12]|uniref:Cation/H+ exchanger transmembrane domain-containing protein n=1 Tax=Candidatus Kerfeldbacteria bacterium CG15_BIG_FIL_POST_REV_8_21_14_020_45_12 TaxID=2014247 RepID=A0A2M7H549_9BACT|nr:MAG: hypothetical protein COW24_00590 [Candidatus Kerfeldbacteria bacterium CG15_BIG_FIL_POST_REV_8_21_14_020_45_12]PJA94082.1 MAG: hypothetical protein CO132_00090 [Candidatus Kerfeldbacteria bacterium CG_4_9_14_3_um_filter_45_8]